MTDPWGSRTDNGKAGSPDDPPTAGHETQGDDHVCLAGLLSLVTPPEVAPRPRDWDSIESELGRLPDDYKAIIDTYGPGRFRSCISVWSPEQILARRRDLNNLLGMLKFYCQQGAYTIDVAPVGVGHEAIGECDDTYLPWGEGRRGTIGLWRTTRFSPDEWPVLLMSLGAIDYESEGLAPYLVANLSGRFRSLVVNNAVVQARNFEADTCEACGHQRGDGDIPER